MDSNHGYTTSDMFVGSYAIVMSSSGGDYNNFVVWEMVDNDEYQANASAIKI